MMVSDEQRISNLEAQKRYRNRVRCRIIDTLGGECSQCGTMDIRVLQIVGSPGKYNQTPTSYYLKALREIDSGNYQLLCANCTTLKRYSR